MALRTLNAELVAELVNKRLPANYPIFDATRVILLIPEALKRLARKIAADQFLRDLLITDPTVAILPVVNGKVNLTTGETDFKFIRECLDLGQIYYWTSTQPMATVSTMMGRQLANHYLANEVKTFYIEANNLIPSPTATTNLSIPAASVNFGTDLFTSTAHGLVTGDAVMIASDTTLPGGLASDTLYFVIKISANTFKLATTYANAIAGTVINLTDAGTGTHTINQNMVKFAVPFYPSSLSDLPNSEELHSLLIDKIMELLPEVGGADIGEDGKK